MRIEQYSASLPSHCLQIVSEFDNIFCAFGNLYRTKPRISLSL